jgi:pimeloyl-ACP methyl ester carboxylesterase
MDGDFVAVPITDGDSGTESEIEWMSAGELLPVQQAANVTTVFMPGSGVCRAQAILWANEAQVLTRSGRAVLYTARRKERRRLRVPLLFNVFPAREMPEVDVLNWSIPDTVTGFMRVSRVVHNRYDEAKHPHALFYNRSWAQTSIGGQSDIEEHVTQTRQAIEECSYDPDRRLVLFGYSRGAAATLLGVTRLSPDEQRRISLVVLEGAFDSVDNVIARRYGWLAMVLVFLLRWYCTADDPRRDPTPLEAADEFPLHIPVLLFCGGRDRVCPPEASEALASKLMARGHRAVTLCRLPRSTHTNMHDGPDKDLYRQALGEAYRNMFR